MSAAAATAVDLPRLIRRRELLIGAAVTAIIAALVLGFGPEPGDAAVHLYRTYLVRHGILVWDNYSYAGWYPLASYSLLYYLPSAVVGNLPLVFGAAVASTVLFSSIAMREWGRAALWPSRVFGVLAAAPMFTGLYAYSLGFTAMLATLKLLQLRRPKIAVLTAILTVGFSPLAFAFLCLIVVSYAVAQRRLERRYLIIGIGLAVSAAIEGAALIAFRSDAGIYPFHWIDFLGVMVVSALGVLVARHARGAAPLTAFFALWGLGSVLFYVVPSPFGDNWTRLGAFVLPVMLLTASLAGFRPRRLILLALACAFTYNLVPYFLLIPSRLHSEAQQQVFWKPALGFLRTHDVPGYRVEVVPTAAHWEADRIPKAGFPLARGWYRQIDEVDNSILYSKDLDAASYVAWLRSAAVRYVLLTPTVPLDWDGGPREAEIVQSRAAGLTLVFHSKNWLIYELPHPTPLLTGPGNPVVSAFGHTVTRGSVSTAGRYLLREHYIPYWHLTGAGCVARGPNDMTVLNLTRPGPFSLAAPRTPMQLVGAKHTNCLSD
ncbi:MAG: hypothetical protein QOG85_2145 [Gaiellaceae bacterium]|jgi:hypothetical protein|nr:hypothetical protein [Gaiellaceae bacterium]